MDSPAEVRKRYQRFFAWTFVLATLLALGMFWVEVAYPPSPLLTSAPAGALGADVNAFDLHDLQLLVAVVALVAALASFAGLVVTTPLVWLEVRRERTRAAIEAALHRQDRINWLAGTRAASWRDGIAHQAHDNMHAQLRRR
jgi:hypothetical protein